MKELERNKEELAKLNAILDDLNKQFNK